MSCLFLYIFGLHATLSLFMPARQGIFVRDILGLVLGKCCKVRHSVTKPFSYKQYYSRKYNLRISLCCERSHVNVSTTCRLEYRKLVNNYSPKWRWLVVDIYRAAKRRGKYPTLATDTEVNSCFSIY